MAVNFDLLKNTFRPAEPSYLNLKIGQLEPLNQKELANLAEFVRMIGTSSKFAMKAHYELSGKNNKESIGFPNNDDYDEDWVYDEDHQQWFKIKS